MGRKPNEYEFQTNREAIDTVSPPLKRALLSEQYERWNSLLDSFGVKDYEIFETLGRLWPESAAHSPSELSRQRNNPTKPFVMAVCRYSAQHELAPKEWSGFTPSIDPQHYRSWLHKPIETSHDERIDREIALSIAAAYMCLPESDRELLRLTAYKLVSHPDAQITGRDPLTRARKTGRNPLTTAFESLCEHGKEIRDYAYDSWPHLGPEHWVTTTLPDGERVHVPVCEEWIERCRDDRRIIELLKDGDVSDIDEWQRS